jgi:hypothetical protein
MPTDRFQVEKIAEQIGSSLMPDNDKWTNRFTVKSQTSSSVYVVAQRRHDAVWGCSCRGWTMHVDPQGRRKCKHLTDILARLAALPAAQAKELAPAVVAMLASARTAYLDLEANPLAVQRPSAGRAVELG